VSGAQSDTCMSVSFVKPRLLAARAGGPVPLFHFLCLSISQHFVGVVGILPPRVTAASAMHTCIPVLFLVVHLLLSGFRLELEARTGILHICCTVGLDSLLVALVTHKQTAIYHAEE